MYSAVTRSNGKGGGNDGGSESGDSWNDFSLVESDKEHADADLPQHRHGSTVAAVAMPRSQSNSSGGMPGGSVHHTQTTEQRGRPQYPTASSDLRSEPPLGNTAVGPGRTLPARPERQRVPSPTASSGHHDDGPSGYEPGYHRRLPDLTQTPASREMKVLTTQAAVRVGEHEPRRDTVERRHSLSETGDPPNDFSKVAGRQTPPHSPAQKAAQPSGQAYRAGGYASASSSLEPVSSKIFDDEDDGQGELRQSHLHAGSSGAGRQVQRHHSTSSDRGRRPLGRQHQDGELDHQSAIDDARVEEQALIPIQPGDRNVAWASQKKRSHSLHQGQGHTHRHASTQQQQQQQHTQAQPIQRPDSGNPLGPVRMMRYPRQSDTTTPIQLMGDSIPELIDANRHESTQFLFAHVSDGMKAAEPPVDKPYMLGVAQRSEALFVRMWGELFAFLSIPLLLVMTFISHLVQFLLSRAVKRPIMLIQVTSDHCLKPLLVVLHNAVVQPILVFVCNIIANSVQMLWPIADFAAHFLHLLTELVRSFRLVEYHRHKGSVASTQDAV
eukprot:scpid97695/ scgid29129/ 